MPGPVDESRCRAVLDHHEREPGLSVRQLAKVHGLSSTMVHRILSGERVVPSDVVPLQVAPPPPDRRGLSRIDDLELRVKELDDLAHEARQAQIYGPAVAAKATAAKLRRELADLQDAVPKGEEEVTADELTGGIMALPDELVPVARQAVERREREGRR